uniref:Uncharacterized protein n=1 Tax=Rhizophora mucronata TaxID=61149 RepID=A0A2P2JJ96_RHIMU
MENINVDGVTRNFLSVRYIIIKKDILIQSLS